MADLKINYNQARQLGKDVTARADEFNSSLSQVKNANEQLKLFWEGSDSQKYADAVAEQAIKMDQLVATINEIGSYLVRVGDAYERVAESNKTNIN